MTVARQPWRHCVTSLRSAHWLVSSLKLVARCPVSGCWPSCMSVDVASSDVHLSRRIKPVWFQPYHAGHHKHVCRSCFYHIRALWGIRGVLDKFTAATVALVSSWLDYANSVLSAHRLSEVSCPSVQRIQNLAKLQIVVFLFNDAITFLICTI